MLGERIAYLRGKLGWSQAQLAKRLNISPSAVGMYEQGRREPPVDILVTLSGTLGVSMDYLLTGRAHSLDDCQMPRGKTEESMADFLKMLTREELMVLLTACLLETKE